MQALFHKKDCSGLHNLFKFALAQHGKHTSAKLKRARFDSEESYKTFARRHNRRKHNEYMKQQLAREWDDPWDQPKRSKRKQADVIHMTSDEYLWRWMAQGAPLPQTEKQQRKAWQAWVKQLNKASEDASTFRSFKGGTQERHASPEGRNQQRHQEGWGPWQSQTFTFWSWEADHEGWYNVDGNGHSRKSNRSQAGRQQKQKAGQTSNASGTAQQSAVRECMQTLGLAVLEASALKQAFLECAKKWHPDRHADDAKAHAETKFKEAQTAYQHLLTCL